MYVRIQWLPPWWLIGEIVSAYSIYVMHEMFVYKCNMLRMEENSKTLFLRHIICSPKLSRWNTALVHFSLSISLSFLLPHSVHNDLIFELIVQFFFQFICMLSTYPSRLHLFGTSCGMHKYTGAPPLFISPYQTDPYNGNNLTLTSLSLK